MELVTIKVYYQPLEAQLTESYLKSNGVFCYLKDANLVNTDPLLANAVGGIKLQVNADAVDLANILLDTYQKHNKENSEACPNCGKNTITIISVSKRGVKGKLSFIVSLLFLIFPFSMDLVNHCNACHHEWETDPLT
jgi:hypothetical protein